MMRAAPAELCTPQMASATCMHIYSTHVLCDTESALDVVSGVKAGACTFRVADYKCCLQR